MNSGTVSAIARTGVLALVIALAAALGLVVGDAIRDRDGSTLNAGYPAGWAGGAAVPVSRTASASFSLDAISAVAAIRDTSASTAVAAEDYPDYPLRHLASPPAAPKTTSPSGPTLR
jgi:hypothetical protein